MASVLGSNDVATTSSMANEIRSNPLKNKVQQLHLGSASLLLSLLTLSAPVAAAPLHETPDDIIVNGQGLPSPAGTPAYGMTIIAHDRLVNSPSGRIETVLTDVAGFQQFRRSDSRSANPSAQGATLRALGGNASSRTLVLLDGVPVADPFFGYIPFDSLVPDRLSDIRITRGSGAGAFGAGAVAGTIELTSANRRDLPRFSASAFYGSHDAREVSAAITPDVGGGFVSVSGRWDRGDGFHTTPPSQRVAATARAAYESWSTGLRAVAPVSDIIELQARALIFRDERTLRFKGADNSSEGQDASIRLVSRGPWAVDALAYLQMRDFSNVVISSTSFRKTLDQRSTPSTGLGGKIELRPPVGENHELRIGGDIRHGDGQTNEDAFNGGTGLLTEHRHAGGAQTTAGMFIEDDWTIGSLILTGGVRADHWSIADGFTRKISAAGVATTTSFANRRDWAFSGRAGALLKLSDGLTLRGAGYTGFRLPTLNELYRTFSVFPVTTQANALLDPEKLKGVEIGAEVRPVAGVIFAATAFYNRLDNAIANVTIGTNLRRRDNVNAIVAKGIELNANMNLTDVSLSASYAYSHSVVDAPGQAFDGLRPSQSARHAASATLAWNPAFGAGVSTTLRYVGKQYEDDLQTDALPDALTLDAVAHVPLGGGFTLVARGENLFDRKVITRNQGGSMDYGTPRTLWIGLRFKG